MIILLLICSIVEAPFIYRPLRHTINNRVSRLTYIGRNKTTSYRNTEQVRQQDRDMSFSIVRHIGSTASVNARAVTSATGL